MSSKLKLPSILYVVQAHHYCIINATVPVLQRYFADEDPRPDFRLGREATQQLLVALKTERQHGWGPTLETLVFLFWVASGSAYRVVSRVFDVYLPSVHRMVDEVVAFLPQFVRLPRVEVVGDGFARLAHHQAFRKAAGVIDSCHIQLCCRASVTIRDTLWTFVWVTQDPCLMHGSLTC